MSECQCPKVKGAICNVTINADDIWKILSRGMDNNGVVQVCFQRKLNFKSHVFFEAVRPTVLQRVLYFLKKYNLLYYDIDIKFDNIPRKLVNIIESNEEKNVSKFITPNEEIIKR